MKILDFLHDKNAQLEWLENEKQTSQSEPYYFSYWWHDNVKGFGLVVTGLDASSMELHLMPDGVVTRHLEVFYPETNERKQLVSDSLQAITFEEFNNLYVDLRERIINYNS